MEMLSDDNSVQKSARPYLLGSPEYIYFLGLQIESTS